MSWNSWKITHGGSTTRMYGVWRQMRSRCRNPKQKGFRNYGGRGIKVCQEWEDFAVFREWALANGYADDLTIERLDNDRGYEPGNCTWIPRREQGRNQRKVLRAPDGTPWVAIAEAHGIAPKAFSDRVCRGWEPSRAATTPLARHNPRGSSKPPIPGTPIPPSCSAGHALTAANVYWPPGRLRPRCRACARLAEAKHQRARHEHIAGHAAP